MTAHDPYEGIIGGLGKKKANGHAAGAGQPDKPDAPGLSGLVLTPAQWAARETPPEDRLLGAVFSTTSRGMFSAETGKGKTMVSIAIAFAIRLGRALMHWKASGKQRRVLFLDGEMPRDLMKERILAACEWFGVEPPEDGLFFLSREDFEDMPPLDTKEGQAWLDAYLAVIRPDFLIADNLMSLTVGSLKETDSWRAIEPWLKSLSKRRIGVLLIHHLGHDKSKSYGDSTKEWTMDYVILGEGVQGSRADVALKITFTKHRRRRPDTSADFASGVVQLDADEWTWTEADTSGRPAGRVSDRARVALDALGSAIAAMGDRPPHHAVTARVDRAVTLPVWRRYYAQVAGYAQDDKGKDAERKAFDRGREQLKAARLVGIWGDWAWPE